MSGKKKQQQRPESIPKAPVSANVPGKQQGFPKLAILGVLVLTALVYSTTLQNGITFIDDDMYILKNPYIRDFSLKGVIAIFTSFFEFNYHPLTTLTYLVEYKLFGTEPLIYHLVNLVLHLINTWLVYTLARQLSGKEFVGFVVSLLFAVHPLHVETVAWISERKGLLCALFYLLALIQYIRYVDSGLQRKFYRISWLVFIAALLSKSAAVTLPVILIVIDAYRGRKITRGVILEKLPFLLLGLLFGVLAIMSQKSGGAFNDITTEYGIINRLFLFASGLSFYFIRFFLPFYLSPIHYFPDVSSTGALQWYYYASLPFIGMVAWLVSRRSAFRKEILFGTFFFFVSISVMLQVITVGSSIAAERYTYVSYIGLFYIIAQLLDAASGRWKGISIQVFSVVMILFCVLSWKRVFAWKDTDTIFTDIIDKNAGNHNNYLVYYHWGEYRQFMGMQQDAITLYDKAIEIAPKYALAYVKRGEAHEWTKSLDKAIKDYDEAIKLDPKMALAYNNNGWAHFEKNDNKTAITLLNKAIELDPKMANAYNNRGWILLQTGDTVAAVNDFDKAIKLSPLFTKPYYNRAFVSINTGKINNAIKDYIALTKIDPNDALAFYNMGLCYYKMNDINSAKANFERSAELGNRDAQSAMMELNSRK